MQKERRTTVGRDKLLATARDLFTRLGASNVGINEVTAAAGLARMTLYNNFPSKDALVAAVYQELADAELDTLRAIGRNGASDERAVLSVFDHFGERARIGSHRGCPFIHASLQEAGASGEVYGIVRRYKQALRTHVYSLLDPRRPNRAELADSLLILMDGAMTEAYLGAVDEPVAAAKRAAAVLLKAGRKVPANARARMTAS